MSGDWIKMRMNLRSHPKVVRMASAIKADKLRVVGALHAVWSVFDEHSADGFLEGYTATTMDAEVGCKGFSEAMISIGWLIEQEDGLMMPRSEEHNGKSAKRRAMETERKKAARDADDGADEPGTDSGRLSASDADKKRSREEKRREEEKKKKPSSSGDDPKAERLRQVTTDAIETFNSILAKPVGLLPKVAATVGFASREKQVRLAIPTARDICAALYGEPLITREFWEAYWAEVSKDDFKSGRTVGGKGHENWIANFKYLVRAETMQDVFDKADIDPEPPTEAPAIAGVH